MKKLFAMAVFVGCLLLLKGCIVHVGSGIQSAKYTFERSLTIETSQLAKFNVETKQGDITIIGEDGRNSIDVKAKISTNEPENFTLQLQESGNTVYLQSHFNSGFKGWTSGAQYIDLVVYMPSEMALEVQQRSGDLSIKNVKKGLNLDDSSGDIDLQNIIGSVDVKDTSGDIKMRSTVGNLYIDDTSGDIKVVETEGNIQIEDTSGDIDLYGTSGSVIVDDSSGDIYVKTARSLQVTDDSSGDVDYSDIQENVSLSK
jgi:DUF4097 and DUF4098 domain-containing protein YvlB